MSDAPERIWVIKGGKWSKNPADFTEKPDEYIRANTRSPISRDEMATAIRATIKGRCPSFQSSAGPLIIDIYIDRIADAILAALPPVAVKVKPLVWERTHIKGDGKEFGGWTDTAKVGPFKVNIDYHRRHEKKGFKEPFYCSLVGGCHDETEIKQLAHMAVSDILSTLTPASEPPSGWRDMDSASAETKAQLQKATAALKEIDEAVSYELNLGNYDHEDVCQLDADWIEVGNIAETALEALPPAPGEQPVSFDFRKFEREAEQPEPERDVIEKARGILSGQDCAPGEQPEPLDKGGDANPDRGNCRPGTAAPLVTSASEQTGALPQATSEEGRIGDSQNITSKPEPVREAANSVDHHQRIGRDMDIINEAIAEYDEWMLDDDFNAQPVLDRIIARMKERRALAEQWDG